MSRRITFFSFYPVKNYNGAILNLDGDCCEKDIDILFYGTISSERRKGYLEELKKHFNMQVITKAFGDEILPRIQRAKIVANIHYYENALLETTRISEALSMEAVIVSERRWIWIPAKNLKKRLCLLRLGMLVNLLENVENY